VLVLGLVEDRAGGQVEDQVKAQDLAKGQVEGQVEDQAEGQAEDRVEDRVEDLAVGLGLNQSLIVDSLQLLCHIYRTCIFCNHHAQKLSTMSSSQQAYNSHHLR